jgi:hypothetical protein
MRHPLLIGIGDAGIADSIRAIAALAPFRIAPVGGYVDDAPIDDLPHWVEALLRAKRDGRAEWFLEWESHRTTKLVSISPRSVRVVFQLPDAFGSVTEGLDLIESLPFEVCSSGSIYPDEWIEMDTPNFGFSRMHSTHGWACAFRGKGHDRLVSRRWLDFGPWRVVRGRGDLTLVQFHDLDVDARTAYSQANPGHERMGISRTGGFLATPYKFTKEVKGLYIAERATLEIVVPLGGKVEQVDMRDACAVRYRHRIDPAAETKIEEVAYVFVDETDARAHLHEMWLRELEVWLADGEGKRRLDLNYRPVSKIPEWVAALESRGS